MASRRIEDLDSRFQGMVRSLLDQGQRAISSSGWQFFITDGFRSFEEQTKLYAQGRTTAGKIVTNAKAGQSAHNYGLAVDMAFQKNGVLSYDKSLYDAVYPIARKLGFALGADWTSFPDKPHFEYPNWQNLINQKESYSMEIDTVTFNKLVKNSSSLDAIADHLKIERNADASRYIEAIKAQVKVETKTVEKIVEKQVEVPKEVVKEVHVVDLKKYEDNGVVIEEQLSPNMKRITNYARKA